MVRDIQVKWLLMVSILLVFSGLGGLTASAAVDQRVYDNADLLSESEIAELEAVAAEHSRKHGTDFLFWTTADEQSLYIQDDMGGFYDTWAEENGQENAVLLSMNIATRDVYLAGFGSAERTLDNQRVDLVLDRIIPEMQRGDYAAAFHETVTTSSRYMEFRPGVNPENIFFKTWFQLAIALLLGTGVVGFMLYNSGGRVTTTSTTYFDDDHTKVTGKLDQFRNKTISRRKVPKKSSGGGGFGGGGSTGGGRSFSGGGRKF